ncbi:MAG: L-seryl-tRNA(Sec) selenium transferase [Acidobacteriota bacterium]|nr:L-seryl-tRNA(Sec) selenium transferase [Acidobacteriota bacterium]
MDNRYRNIPAIHRLLDLPALRSAADQYGHTAVMEACRCAVDRLRQRVADGEEPEDAPDDLVEALEREILDALRVAGQPAYPALINATGVLLHTNLGRAPLRRDLPPSLKSYLALEYDVTEGRRGQRLAPLAERIAATCGAASAVMVNNNAAALFLMLMTHARDREVIVSRGQLIEIGGSFRLPDVMSAAGAKLVEVGCTNRTHLKDYAAAINENTAAILVAHQSNFRIVGFTAGPTTGELAELAHAHGLPFFVDQGCGALHDLRRWSIPHEETVGEILSAGADAVCFSGDKLLGGPQAGLIVGSTEWVAPLGRHPLYRALRPDKTALVLMDEVLAAHASGRLEDIPLYAMLGASLDSLKRRARTIGRRLRSAGLPARGRTTRAALGGGTTPEETVASYGLSVAGGQELADRLRAVTPPVIGRIEDDAVVLDLRSVFPDQDRQLETTVVEAYKSVVQAIQDDGA